MAGRKSRRFKQLSLSMCFFKLWGGGRLTFYRIIFYVVKTVWSSTRSCLCPSSSKCLKKTPLHILDVQFLLTSFNTFIIFDFNQLP